MFTGGTKVRRIFQYLFGLKMNKHCTFSQKYPLPTNFCNEFFVKNEARFARIELVNLK